MTSNIGAAEVAALNAPQLSFERHWGAEKHFDKSAVFKPLGEAELRRVLDIELAHVPQRILTSS